MGTNEIAAEGVDPGAVRGSGGGRLRRAGHCAGIPCRGRPRPSPGRRDGLGPFPAEPLEVEVLDELRQWRFPRFLPVVGDLAELAWVQAEFAGHLHLRVREVVPLARLSPGLCLGGRDFGIFPMLLWSYRN